jgi:hypothetical protein
MHKIAVLDLETDPFEHGKFIKPFVAGFYDGTTFSSFWSHDCVDRLVSMLAETPEPFTIYAHNGGRFDFFYFLEYIERELRIVNGRIIQAWLGHHELRDSFAIMPFALEQYKKTPIDYDKFKPDVRDQHRDEITSYLRDDCVDLYELCTTFNQEFGTALTIGSASMKQLKRFHTFATGNEVYDAKFRKDFYFGGRNQVFRAGIIRAPIRVYDVNSMYASVMRDCLHPVSTGIYVGTKIDKQTAFVTVQGTNYGAFPTRRDDNSLDFTQETGTFHTTIHEFEAALETGAFKPERILKTYGFSRRESFSDFVNHFYNARNKARASGDKIRTLFYKFVLNSGYGKFAQNPENYSDWYITEYGEFPPTWHECTKVCPNECRERWTPAFISGNDYIIWSRPLKEHFYYNIATGASITGAARAVLLRGLRAAVNPYYCDTDSIMCESLSGVPVSDSDLGAWKLECEGDRAAICGKKLYAVWNGEDGIKKAHKGARLTFDEIWRVAKGGEIEACNPVPAFKWDGSYRFTKRTIRSTA